MNRVISLIIFCVVAHASRPDESRPSTSATPRVRRANHARRKGENEPDWESIISRIWQDDKGVSGIDAHAILAARRGEEKMISAQTVRYYLWLAKMEDAAMRVLGDEETGTRITLPDDEYRQLIANVVSNLDKGSENDMLVDAIVELRKRGHYERPSVTRSRVKTERSIVRARKVAEKVLQESRGDDVDEEEEEENTTDDGPRQHGPDDTMIESFISTLLRENRKMKAPQIQALLTRELKGKRILPINTVLDYARLIRIELEIEDELKRKGWKATPRNVPSDRPSYSAIIARTVSKGGSLSDMLRRALYKLRKNQYFHKPRKVFDDIRAAKRAMNRP